MIVEYDCEHTTVTTDHDYPDHCPTCGVGASVSVWHEQGCDCGLCRWLRG